ncbi:MAG: cell wall hydrolase [Sphingomonas phyllosphaerae]
MRAILGGIATSALVAPALIARHTPEVPRAIAAKVVRPQRVVAASEVPTVEPVELQDLTPADARLFNAAIPFVRGPRPAARPFLFAGDETQRGRATDCLAAAAWYEAGDDPVGERAVVQVVLNRLRHPAFPKTVCGVVFQGQERTTGCQFTFTCDGALTRRPSEPAWERARQIATKALNGAVFAKVGYATHYHTDWVVPYWSASLDKLAEVNTHLFFRWTGWWGTPAAFRRVVSSDEPVIAKLGTISAAHRLGGALDEAAAAVAAAAEPGTLVAPVATSIVPGEPDSFTALLPAIAPEGYSAIAKSACGARTKCKFLGWTDRAMLPGGTPMTATQMAGMSFSYLRDKDAGLERELWNCREFPRTGPGLCMRRQVVPAPSPSTTPVLRGPGALDGVRRREEPLAAATPAALP